MIKLFQVFGLLLLVFQNRCFADQIWLLVDTRKLELNVMQGQKKLKTFSNISIGRNGAGFKRKVGDDITPLGKYQIGWVNNDSQYYRFFGFNYPSIADAEKGLKQGLIRQPVYLKILQNHKNKQTPPQNTPLGGRIGIHGLGQADIDIHRILNWTHGCIALTNRQIDALTPWIKEGTWVTVK